MEAIKDLFTSYWILSVAASWLLAQIIKVFTNMYQNRGCGFSIKEMVFANGGMPSAHTASVISLATSIAWSEGLGSVSFAIAILLAIVVMTDAVGVRRQAGFHAKKLNEMLGLDANSEEKPYRELIGHTPLEVFFGALIGIATPSLLSLIPLFGLH